MSTSQQTRACALLAFCRHARFGNLWTPRELVQNPQKSGDLLRFSIGNWTGRPEIFQWLNYFCGGHGIFPPAHM
ncbi:hypothetical protein EUGRSUZ_C00356 [Eucalyptus grandis]|uniref:Uncharacterized protein n=2 Tax=Eucalyptus grandis TaxID=71139 RepID=A0ACC3LA25_EUCGR|nr:hypothetical protein EUGRSUZ_C00356 [Eucalyptus grandis]